jgi:hypothetical protein
LIRDDLGLAWVNNTGSHESQHLWGSDVDDVGRRGFPPLLYLSDLVLRECRSVSSSTMPIGHFLYIAWSETGHHNYELVDAPYHERDSVRVPLECPLGWPSTNSLQTRISRYVLYVHEAANNLHMLHSILLSKN